MTRRWLAAASVVLIACGTSGIIAWHHDRPPADVAPPAVTVAQPRVTPSASAGSTLPTHSITLSHLSSDRGHEPRLLSVPAERISGPVLAVGTDARTHVLSVPATTTRIAWWAYGSRPGDSHGTVVMAAHVDFNGKLGLFFNLDRVPVGSLVRVQLRDGRSVAYRVDGRQHIDKAQLNQLGIFTRGGPARLILITCGGSFDAATRSYRENIVVTAHPVT
jgi:LPXTG-site transpeptidase (sortase) family protein